ncbi:unnamed protein product [Echinostoma caproni]|uniref:Uncharacterized protein n=1 Tax=Echinostoma caproni TaxID=27848 RepID=A0A183AAX6_9TREM|nr:unnamed protein product [Echinostoma caproni]
MSRLHARHPQEFIIDHRRSLSRHGPEPHRVRAHRRSFPRTKFYVIDEPRIPLSAHVHEMWHPHSGDSNIVDYYPSVCPTTTEMRTGYTYDQLPCTTPVGDAEFCPARCLPNPSRVSMHPNMFDLGNAGGELISNSIGPGLIDKRDGSMVRVVSPTRRPVARVPDYRMEMKHDVDEALLAHRLNETRNKTRMRPIHPGRASPVVGHPTCRSDVRSRLDYLTPRDMNSRSATTNTSSHGTRITLDDVLDFHGPHNAQVLGRRPLHCSLEEEDQESSPPSLLRSSNPTTTRTNAASDLCESLCVSLSRFRLPPTPPPGETSLSPKPRARTGRELDSGDLYSEVPATLMLFRSFPLLCSVTYHLFTMNKLTVYY